MKTRKICVWRVVGKPWMSINLQGKKARKSSAGKKKRSKRKIKLKLMGTYDVPKVFATDIVEHIYHFLADSNIRYKKERDLYLVTKDEIEHALTHGKKSVMGELAEMETYKRKFHDSRKALAGLQKYVETQLSKTYVVYGVDSSDYLFHEGVYTSREEARIKALARVLKLSNDSEDAEKVNRVRDGYEYWHTSSGAIVVLERVEFSYRKYQN
ncbi:MAG: hypothetical protein GY703_14950 [Gammaproteobacteria bacterium]|nr:hypothetical protein [Gammaproteobacteria bacterium]